MAQSKKQLANLKSNSERTPRERKKQASKAGRASGASRRRHKSLEETVMMVAKLPLDDIGLSRAKRAGVSLDDMDDYDMTALTGMVIGQVRAAASGSSQAAKNVAEWMDLAAKHKKQQLENEKLQAEIQKLKAEIERLNSGLGADDDDLVLQFIEGMKNDNTDS